MVFLGILYVKVFVDDCNVFNFLLNISSKTFHFNFAVLLREKKESQQNAKIEVLEAQAKDQKTWYF